MFFSQRNKIGMIAAAVIIFGTSAFAQQDMIRRSFSDIVKKVEPAVVSIDTKSQVNQPVARGNPQPNDSEDIMDFFRRQMPQRPVYAVGSGFIVDKAGYIVTNNHVIDDAGRITVKLDSGEEYPATVVGTDRETDIAILKIDAGHELPMVRFGDSDKAEVGDWVLTIGSPFNLAKTVSAGIISTTNRQTEVTTAFQKFIQTDAVINPGNSGGPLINVDGEVIGVNSQIATTTGEYNGVGFALPSRDASFVYEQIVKNGKVRRGYLGAYLDSVKTEFAKVYGLKEAKGAIVTEIRDKSGPAARAGLLVGDVITDFNGASVDNAQDLIGKIAVTSPDQNVTMGVLRENGTALDRKSFTTKLGERPITGPTRAGENPDKRVLNVDASAPIKPFGLTLTELTPATASKYNLDGQKGLVITEDLDQTSFIADVRNSTGGTALRKGDVIQRINRVTVTDLKSFEKIVSGLKVGDPVVLHVITYNQVVHAPQTKIVQFTVK